MKPAGIERVEKPAISLEWLAMLRITKDRNPQDGEWLRRSRELPRMVDFSGEPEW